MKALLLVCMLLHALPSPDDDWTAQMLLILGVDSEEMVSDADIQAFDHLHRHPLDLNHASLATLCSSALFSEAQALAILDYRKANGDILSFFELSSIPGIPDIEALRPFVVLSGNLPSASVDRVHSDLTSKSGIRRTGAKEESSAFSAKAGIGYGQRAEANAGWSEGSLSSWNVSARMKRSDVRIVVGDFNLRFGQGLGMWSGVSMAGLRRASAFSRNPTGLSVSHSYSGENRHRGVGADLWLGHLCLTSFATFKGLFGANARLVGRRGTLSVSALSEPDEERSLLAADFKATILNATFFGEAAWSWGPAAIAGVVWRPAYKTAFSALVRYYDPLYQGQYAGAYRSSSHVRDESGIALAGEWRWARFSADAASHPQAGSFKHKGEVVVSPALTLGSWNLTPLLRASSTCNSEWRNELRGELTAQAGWLTAHARADAVWGAEDLSWLWVADVRVKRERWSAFLRGGLFKVDEWKHRIYVYERDLPTNFTVWPYYGRGYTLSAYASWRWIHLRIGYIDYPWMEKEPRLELKCGCVVRI